MGDVVDVYLVLTGVIGHPDHVISIYHGISVIGCPLGDLHLFLCLEVVEVYLEMAVSFVGIYDPAAAYIGAAMVYLIIGYGQLFVFGDIVKIDIVVAIAVVRPDNAALRERGVGLVVGAVTYGDVGQDLEVEHINIRVSGPFAEVRPDHSPLSDIRLHLDAAGSEELLNPGADIIEDDVRYIAQEDDRLAINAWIGLYAGSVEGGGLPGFQIHKGDVRLSGAVVSPGQDVAADSWKGLVAGTGGDGRLASRFDIIEVDIKISGALVHPGDAIPLNLGLDLLLLTGGDDLLLAGGQLIEADAVAAIAIIGPDHIIPAYVRLGLVALRRNDYGFGSVDGIIEVDVSVASSHVLPDYALA